VCRPRGVHVMSHMLVLDARLCVLRENVPDHHLPGCGCVGTTRTSNPLREVYVASNLVFFCNICVEEILAGNRSLGTLNARGYINLGQFFFSNMETIYPKSVLLENHFGPILV
jgi:hypothetical protein